MHRLINRPLTISRKSLAFPPEGMLLNTMTLCYVFGVLLALTVTGGARGH